MCKIQKYEFVILNATLIKLLKINEYGIAQYLCFQCDHVNISKTMVSQEKCGYCVKTQNQNIFTI